MTLWTHLGVEFSLWCPVGTVKIDGLCILITSDPIYYHGLTLMLAMISNYIYYKVWYEIIHPYPELKPCSHWSLRMEKEFHLALVKKGTQRIGNCFQRHIWMRHRPKMSSYLRFYHVNKWNITITWDYWKGNELVVQRKPSVDTVIFPTMHHYVTEMCTWVHISVTKWWIAGYLTNALWVLLEGCIVIFRLGNNTGWTAMLFFIKRKRIGPHVSFRVSDMLWHFSGTMPTFGSVFGKTSNDILVNCGINRQSLMKSDHGASHNFTAMLRQNVAVSFRAWHYFYDASTHHGTQPLQHVPRRLGMFDKKQ